MCKFIYINTTRWYFEQNYRLIKRSETLKSEEESNQNSNIFPKEKKTELALKCYFPQYLIEIIREKSLENLFKYKKKMINKNT